MGGRSEMRVQSGGPGGGGSGCFASGTFVKTAAGPRYIATLGKGDLVVTFDQQRNTQVVRPILKVVHKRNVIWEIKFVDGQILRTTATHSLCVAGAWKKVCEIKAGDFLTCVTNDCISDCTGIVTPPTHCGYRAPLDSIIHRCSFP